MGRKNPWSMTMGGMVIRQILRGSRNTASGQRPSAYQTAMTAGPTPRNMTCRSRKPAAESGGSPPIVLIDHG